MKRDVLSLLSPCGLYESTAPPPAHFYDGGNRNWYVSSVSLMCAMKVSGLMAYRFHRNCLKIFADRLPLRGSWLRSRLIGRGWNPRGLSWDPFVRISILRIDLPSHPFGELSRGRAFAFYDRDICPRNVSSVSHMCAYYRIQKSWSF